MKAKTMPYRSLFEETVEEPFFLPKIMPSAEHVIQGIAKPKLKPKPSVANREAALKARRTVERTLVPTRLNGKHFVKHLNREGNNVNHRVKREDSGNSLCKFCDFLDKKYGYCLIKRLNGKEAPCLYNPPNRNRNPSQNTQKLDGLVRISLQKEGGVHS